MGKARPKTGEPRRTRRPLSIDRLPLSVHDEILKLRALGRSWPEIEELSKSFVKWDEQPTAVLELFPDLRIPHSNLHRWYDLRVEQVRKEALSEAEATRAFAEKLGAAGLTNINDVVMNAMRDAVFDFTKDIDAGSKLGFVKLLDKLGLTLSRLQRVDLQRKRVEADLAKIDAERARIAAEAGDPREIFLLATQYVLKTLRTREQLRAVIDPIGKS
jgi:hypothetical protein